MADVPELKYRKRKAGNETHPSRETAVPSQGTAEKGGGGGWRFGEDPSKGAWAGQQHLGQHSSQPRLPSVQPCQKEKAGKPAEFLLALGMLAAAPSKQDRAALGSRQSWGPTVSRGQTPCSLLTVAAIYRLPFPGTQADLLLIVNHIFFPKTSTTGLG